MVLGELRARCAGVIRQNAQQRANRKARDDVGVGLAFARQNAVLLIRTAQHISRHDTAVDATYLSVAEIAFLLLRATVAAHGHPAGVDDGPALVGLMPDHGREHTQRQFVGRAHANVMHDEIEEHIHPGTDFGHAVEMRCRKRRRGRADAYHRTRQTGLAQTRRRQHAPRTFLFGDGGERLGRVEVVAGAGMRHHAAERCAAVVKHAGDVEQRGFVRTNARAVSVGIDLDPHVERLTVLGAERDDRLSGRHAVGDDLQVAAATPQGKRCGQLARDHSHGIEDVGHAVVEEACRFLERRDGDALRAGFDLRVRDFHAFAGLDVRAEAHAEGVHARLHAANVVLHARHVDDGGRGFERLQRGEGDVVDRSHGTRFR